MAASTSPRWPGSPTRRSPSRSRPRRRRRRRAKRSPTGSRPSPPRSTTARRRRRPPARIRTAPPRRRCSLTSRARLTTYEDSPTSPPPPTPRSPPRTNLAKSLNAGDAAVNQVREQADKDMASSVSTITSLLGQFQPPTTRSSAGLACGANVADRRGHARFACDPARAADRRRDLDRLQRLDVDLHRQRRHAVPGHAAHRLLHAHLVLVDGVDRAPVTVDGVPITGASASKPIQSGALAGYAELRDTLAPQYQAQLDQIAGGLINAFAESDRPAPPRRPCRAFSPRGGDGPPAGLGLRQASRRRSRSIRRRPVTGRKRRPCCATAASPTPNLAMSTMLPARRATRAHPDSSSARSDRRPRPSTRPPPASTATPAVRDLDRLTPTPR